MRGAGAGCRILTAFLDGRQDSVQQVLVEHLLCVKTVPSDEGIPGWMERGSHSGGICCPLGAESGCFTGKCIYI